MRFTIFINMRKLKIIHALIINGTGEITPRSPASSIIAPVSFQVATHQTEGYTVNTALYEGPLDLLLELIERAELDITRLALAQVTDQYLAYMHNLGDRDAAEVSAFLIIAARLVQIKSAALLPRQTVETNSEEGAIDDADALARQLLLYKRFKEISAALAAREAQNLRTYLRVASPVVKMDARFDLSDITLTNLIQAAREVLGAQPNLPGLSRVVAMPRVTIRERIRNIIDTLRRLGSSSFQAMLSPQYTRLEVVVTFLAMLELVKRHTIEAQQSDIFGEIQLQSIGNLDDSIEVETEFGE